MIKKIIFISLLPIFSFAQFGIFDNFNKTKSKEDSQQQTQIQKLNSRIHEQNIKINEQSERIDGLISLIEGMSSDLNELRNKKAPTQIDNKPLIIELGKMIDEINSKYISKNEVLSLLNKNKSQPKKKKRKIKNKKVEKFESTSAKIYSKAVRLFYNKRYIQAKKRFLVLLEKKHKLSSTNYFLGEIAYYKKDYQNAIHYYKKSVSLNDTASYMSLLLYHAAYSLEKTNQKETAISFYQNIIDSYDDKYSKLAERRLTEISVN